LVNADEDDLIIISDLDEIPNMEQIGKFNSNMRYAVFKQKHFYYKINLQSQKNPFWYGSKICVKKYLKSPQWLRNLKFKKRPFWRIDKLQLNNIIENGGWHFCNLKQPSELLYKYKNMAETNDPYFTKNKIDDKYLSIKQIEDSIEKGKNLVGKNEHFKKIKIDDRFPNYIIGNLEKFNHWLL
jgi:beta-1,4-mannosyl-glycoprotein beta-1,4-N-acetylglucosaminyltransferase